MSLFSSSRGGELNDGLGLVGATFTFRMFPGRYAIFAAGVEDSLVGQNHYVTIAENTYVGIVRRAKVANDGSYVDITTTVKGGAA